MRSAHARLDGVSADLADLYMFVVYKQNSHGGRGGSLDSVTDCDVRAGVHAGYVQ